MSIKFEKIQAGQTLYDMHTYRMGHTTMKTYGVWVVSVIEVDSEKRKALVSWNGNKPEWRYERWLTKLRAKKPEMITNSCGQQFPKRREKKLPKAAEEIK